ncbi:MAG: shikimate dehydrogenase [Alphaproteobacteria bacterium]|nr:shikimate dehydrogenase [Alphaproteobacteria bacterium]
MSPVSGRTRVFALIGHPVAHSLSPALHNGELAAHGVDAVYVALPVDPAHRDRVAGAIRTLGLAGCNLTVPFKEAVVHGLDAVEGVARVIGAVNTVVRDGQRLVGHNTDADGFVAGLHEAFGPVAPGCTALVLGAGGAGLAVGVGLARAGARQVTWLNRTPERAQAAVDRCQAALPSTHLHAGPLDARTFAALAPHADVIVQATSGGGTAVVEGLDPQAVRDDAIWVDLNYWMADPPLWRALAARGVRLQDGRPMLVHQAALALGLLTGISPDTDRMRARIG